MRSLAVTPTLVIVGVNRSGTTALAHSLLNHPHVELFKDPGKYTFESTGVADFSHFYQDPLSTTTRVRVIKQSIGQYTPELCTIPIYPVGVERPRFIRELHHLFLVREPRDIWSSWQAMTTWLQTTSDPEVRSAWAGITRDHGIPVGWGSLGMLHLAVSYFRELFEHISSISPATTYLATYDDLQDSDRAARLLHTLCERLGLDFRPEMIDWKIRFGDDPEGRMVDGFRRPLNDPQRIYIHRKIRESSGLGLLLPQPPENAHWPDTPLTRELDTAYADLLERTRSNFNLTD